MLEKEPPFNVFLIEDDEVDILSIKHEFNRLKIPLNFYVAKNGEEALNMLYGLNGMIQLYPAPNVIILDIYMPKMDGIEFLKKIRTDKNFNHIPVYIVTGLYSTKDKLATHDLDVTGRIVKPIEFDDVLRIYWTMIGQPI
jgi:CheY-like chemotaxis protein